MSATGDERDALVELIRYAPCVVVMDLGYNLTCFGSAAKKHPECAAAVIRANPEVVLRAFLEDEAE